MTINGIEMDSSKDLFSPNKVMNLPKAKSENLKLSGVSWVSARSFKNDSLSDVLEIAFHQIFRNVQSYEIWVLVGTSSWQPNTAMVKYRQLWGALKLRGFRIAQNGIEVKSKTIEIDGRLKFFCAAKIREVDVADVSQLLREERCAYIVALPRNLDVSSLLDFGWSGDLQDDMKFISDVVALGGIVVKKIGEFDDSEQGVVAIGSPVVITNLFGNDLG